MSSYSDEDESSSDSEDSESDISAEFDGAEISTEGGIGGIVLALLPIGVVWLYYQTQIVGQGLPLLFVG